MKAVILAAGASTRCYPLTLSRPKPLLPLANTPILLRTIAMLDGLVDGIIVVAGYKAELLKESIRELSSDAHIEVVLQDEPKGTGHALLQAKDACAEDTGEFILVLNGDDLFARADLQALLVTTKSDARPGAAILVQEVPAAEKHRFGMVRAKEGILVALEEKPPQQGGAELATEPGSAYTGAAILPSSVFTLLESLEPSPRGELELTDALLALNKTRPISVVTGFGWLPLAYPWDLLVANRAVMGAMVEDLTISPEAEIENGATIKGPVAIGKGTRVLAGSYIEGPVMIGEDCLIGPNCYLRPWTCIGDDCHIGQAVELKSTLVFDQTNIAHLSYVGDSIIGEGVNLGAGTIVANLRHDGGTVKSMVRGKLVDTGLRKFGAVIGDNAKVGIHTSILPGRKLWPQTHTRPAQVVERDIMPEGGA
ncbi:glucose-1-phosphate thymidylyltransferase [Candidatus Woesearchaeota archaeon CG_4_10_14_0_2_um_filter_57_5]|nr:MAG: glucose-1-phosphate thymidylyltransferase [Candidatus Woesearchaeota archaeon CG_4_10_14_0_2_um_filter_57_5]